MMKKMLILLLSLVMSACLFVLVACGNDDNSETKPTTTPEPTTQTDTIAPTINVENVPTSGAFGEQITLPRVSVTDNVDGDLTSGVKVKVESGVFTEEQTQVYSVFIETQVVDESGITFTPSDIRTFQYRITYSAVDAAGNNASEFVIFTAYDNILPKISVENVPTSGAFGEQITLPSATAKDNKDGNLSHLVKVTVESIIGEGDTESVVEVLIDNVLVPQAGITFTASDMRTMKYRITYSVVDSSNNKGAEIFYITVSDTVEPKITINGEIATSGYAQEEVVLPSASAVDNRDGDLSADVKVSVIYYDKGNAVKTYIDNLPANVENKFTPDVGHNEIKIIYSVTDANDNETSEEILFSNLGLRPDNTNPVITVSGIAQSGNFGESVNLPIATAVDDKDGDLSSNVKVTVQAIDGEDVLETILDNVSASTQQSFTPSRKDTLTYKIIYSVSDAAGNTCNEVVIFTAIDNVKPIFNISGNNPTSGYLGESVNLAFVGATDNRDGDLSATIRVLVYQSKPNGQIVRTYVDGLLSENSEFVPEGQYEDFTVVYKVSDACENTESYSFFFKLLGDRNAPTISVDETFDLEMGIECKSTDDIILPSATAKDISNNDITASSYIAIYNNENYNIVKIIENAKNGAVIRLFAGEYSVVYKVWDAQNRESRRVSFPLNVARFDVEENLIKNSKNITIGNDARINEYNELEIGKTANGVIDPYFSCATVNSIKIFDEYVALKVNFDVPSASAPEDFYDISIRGNQTKLALTPSGMTGQEGIYPPYLLLRITSRSINLLGTGGDQVNMKYVRTYDGSLLDGNDHVMFIQIKNDGLKSTSANAKISIKVWIDTDPTKTPSIEAYVTRNSTLANDVAGGKLNSDAFDMLWDSALGSGCITFSGATNAPKNGLFGDDRLTVKSLIVYPSDTKVFDVDLISPVITVDAPENKYSYGSSITFNSATITDAGKDISERLVVTLTDANNNIIELDETLSVSGLAVGQYTITYYADDISGNFTKVSYVFRVSTDDTVSPEIELDETTVEIYIGQSIKIRSVSASDNVDGDISSSVNIRIEGPQTIEGLKSGNSVTLNAAGEYRIVYTATDFAGNGTDKYYIVNVTSYKTGNLLENDIENFNGSGTKANNEVTILGSKEQYMHYDGQMIYDEKVAMTLNFSGSGNILLINLRGDYVRDVWIMGLVLKFDLNGVHVSTKGHDVQSIGTANSPFADAINRNKDVTIEYQTTDVYKDGERYVMVSVWFEGQQLVFTPNAANKGKIGADNRSIMIKVTDMVAPANADAGYFYACLIDFVPGSEVSKLVIKDFRIDGSPLGTNVELIVPDLDGGEEEIPEYIYTVPQEPASILQFAEGGSLNPQDDVAFVNYIGEEIITLKLKASDITLSSTLIIKMVGNYGIWSKGLGFRIDRGIFNFYTGVWSQNCVCSAQQSALYKTSEDFTYLQIKATYIKNKAGYILGIKFEVWQGTTLEQMEKLTWSADTTAYSNYITAGDLTVYFEDMMAKGLTEDIFAPNTTVDVMYYQGESKGTLEIESVTIG